MKNLIIFIGVIVLTSGSILGIVGASGYFGNTPPRVSASMHMVSLLKDRIEPNTVLVKQGEFVQFNSKDGKSHHLSPGKGKASNDGHEHAGMGLESGVFGSDEAYRVQFKKPGTYEFHDHNNPKLRVTVVAYKPVR